jgi:hypothetical protein
MSIRTLRLAALLLAIVPHADAAPPEGLPLPGLAVPEPPAQPPAPTSVAPLKFASQAEGFWGTVSGKQVLPDCGPVASWDDPTRKRTWQSEQDWRCPLAGPLAVFGKVGATSEEAAQRDLTLSGRTGLACQLGAPLGAELTLRGGPSLSCADPLRPEKAQPHREVFVEVQGRLPLFWGVGLEFQGNAVPALAPMDRDRVEQDVRLAFPFGETGKIKLGAKRRWESVPEAKPLPTATELYLGLERAW